MKRCISLREGFSLIEMIIALGIFATVISIGIVGYTGYSSTARDARRKVDLEEIRSALEIYKSDSISAAYPIDGNLTALVPQYLQQLPVDPLTKEVYEYNALPDSPPCDNTPGNLCNSYHLVTSLEGGTSYQVGPDYTGLIAQASPSVMPEGTGMPDNINDLTPTITQPQYNYCPETCDPFSNVYQAECQNCVYNYCFTGCVVRRSCAEEYADLCTTCPIGCNFEDYGKGACAVCYSTTCFESCSPGNTCPSYCK
ncbi:type II secretion system protein [Candidatus Woesebacteria bacterium]|nr:type II secretion system protein [Candidatus Woesebacteria bacterium]